MRWLICFILTLSFLLCKGQRVLLAGQVLDANSQVIIGAHVRNISSDKITVSNHDGRFQLPSQPGDTLHISFVSFASLTYSLRVEDFKGDMILTMKETILGLEEVTILSLPTLEKFKEMIMEEKVIDSVEFWYFGVGKSQPISYKMESGKVHKKFLYALSQPTSFLYYNLSKQEKEKRKYYQITHSQDARENAEQKFTRAWVSEQTGLIGDELTNFIAFCDFTYDYLNRFPLYVIREDMMAKLIEFKK